MNVKVSCPYMGGGETLDRYPCLAEFGAKLVEGEYRVYCTITINSLDDIISLIKKTGSHIIIEENGDIEIYDGYRE